MPPNRPSLTAIKVARELVLLGRNEHIGPLLPAGAAKVTEELLLATGGLKPWMLHLYDSPRQRVWIERSRDLLYPGLSARLGLRKRFMDDEIRDAIEAGATQILVVGAGYDTACMRLAPELEECLFVEIDHPGTHGSKSDAVEALGRLPANLKLLGVDLAESTLSETLAARSVGWDPRATSIVIAEGLLMYLSEAEISSFLEAVYGLTGLGSRVAFTYVGCDAWGRPDIGRGSLLLRQFFWLIGERLKWCVPSEEALAAFVADHGWRYVPDPERFDLGARYLRPAGFDAGARALELMALIEREPSWCPLSPPGRSRSSGRRRRVGGA